MKKITHKNRYESSKLKKRKECIKKNDIRFVDDINLDYGIIIETSYNDADVLYKDEVIKVRLASSFNLICNQTIYPGDKVIIDGNVIKGIIKRKNLLCRDKSDGTKINSIGIKKIVAVNIDLAVIVVSAGYPPLHPKFIDRYAILLNSNDIPFIVVMNKSDLKSKKEESILSLYRNLGIRVIETSTKDDIGIDELKSTLHGRQTILVGHSGVGKSSIINAIMENDKTQVGSLGKKSRRGRHTTTTSRYYYWNDVSSIIDTPGIRSLDISNFDVYEIQDYFKEISLLRGKCKYKDCLHFDEEDNDCYVKQGVNNKLVTKERYESYAKIIEELVNKKRK